MRGRSPRCTWLLVLAAALVVASRVAAVYSVAGNWDEFALFEAASITAERGVLYSAGRPGLAQLIVLPLVAGCDDEIRVLHAARLIWLFFTLAIIGGLGVLIAQLQRDPERRLGDAALGIGLLALVPTFLEWSIQVRTDQLALAGGLWGGVALLASRRRPLIALAAGALFAIGFLSSQKLFYVAALTATLALGQLLVAWELRPKREAIRAALCLAAFAASLVVFHTATKMAIEIAPNHASAVVLSPKIVRDGLGVFDFYRATIGYSQYRAMLPSLVPHFILFAGLVAATVTVWRGRREGRAAVMLAWSVLALGGAVGAFHAAAFYYFWMTLGLFPAIAFAIARVPITNLLPEDARLRGLTVAGFWLLLAAPGVSEMALLTIDTQSVQRESLGFVHRNFRREDAGFNPESALFCRGEGQPIGHYFSATIYQKLGKPGTERNRVQLIQQFRDEPVLFIVESFRLNQFPVEVRRFWADNYQPYSASVFVAGRHLAGTAGAETGFELIAAGPYRWLPFDGPRSVHVDGQALSAGDVIRLGSGEHVATFSEDVPGGILVWAIAEPPGKAPVSFYKTY